MLKLFKIEIKKLWSIKAFLLYLLILIFANVFLIWFNIDSTSQTIPPKAYKQISQDLMDMQESEKLSFIQEKIVVLEGLRKIELTIEKFQINPELANTFKNDTYLEDFEKYSEIYLQGDYLEYAKSITAEHTFLKIIEKELMQVSNYESFLTDLEGKAEQLFTFSIFGGEGSYDHNNITTTQKTYQNMSGIEITYTPQKGIYQAIQFYITDIILIFTMILLSFMIVREEKDNGVLTLIRSTSAGKGKTAITKILVLAVSLFAIVCLLYGTNLLYCSFSLGLGDLSRSIQSLPFLMRSVLKINISEYLVLFVFTKWIAAFICGCWILFAMFVAKKVSHGCFLSALLPLIFYFIRVLIPATHKLNVFRYANLISLLQSNEILGGYHNLYWFNNKTIPLVTVEFTFAIVFALFCTGLFYCAFSTLSIIQSKKAKFTLLKTKSTQIKHTTITKLECKKLFIVNGVLFILIVAVGVQIFQSQAEKQELPQEELFYAEYMKEITGPYNMDTYNYLMNQQIELAPLIESEKLYMQQKITSEEFHSFANLHFVLNIKYEQYKNVLSNLSYLKEYEGAQLIYATGYEMLFSYNPYINQSRPDAIYAVIVTILSFTGFFVMEKNSGMRKVLASTPLGRDKTVKTKIKISVIVSCFIAVLSILPLFVETVRLYGLYGLFVPAKSLVAYKDVWTSVPIIAIVLLMIFSRILACLLVSSVTLALSQKFKSYVMILMVSNLVFLFPLVLSMLGVDFMQWLSIYPMFDVTALIAQEGIIAFSPWLYIIGAIGIIYVCYDYLIDCYTWYFERL